MGFFNSPSYQNSKVNWVQNAERNAALQAIAGKSIAGVYGWMSLGVFISACTGIGLVQSGALQALLTSVGSGLFIGVFVVQIAVVLGMSFASGKMSASSLKGLFLLYSALTGFTFAVIMTTYNIGNVIALFAVAAVGFAALALFGALTKKNLGFMGTFLIMGLFMVIGASIVNIFVSSAMLQSFVGWAGILVFSGLTAYDSQRIRQGAFEIVQTNRGDSEVIGKFMIFGALTMYLNFINLFISLLQVFGGRRN